MVAVDGRSDRLYWGIGNLVGAVACLPICWGLPSQDWVTLKIGASLGGIFLGVNSTRLISNHDRNAPIRAAWLESTLMVNGAWIEQMAIANLPTTIHQQQPVSAGSDYYPPQLPSQNYQLPTNNSRPEPTEEDLPERGGDRKMPNLTAYPSVLIYGIPGSGKTTFAQQEAQKHLALGHKVLALDTHAAYGAWKGCEVVGGGMNYKAIDAKLEWLFKEIQERYQRIESEPNPRFQPLAVFPEEFTKWSRKVKNAEELFWTALTDIRKVEIYIKFISHTRTLVAMGGAKGSADLRDEALLEVELQGESNEATGRATPKFQALVKMPGKSLSDRFLVPIERISGQPSRAQPATDWKLPPQPLEKLGNPYGMRTEAKPAILDEILSQPGNCPLFTSAIDLPHEEKLKIAKLVIEAKLGTEMTILCLWGYKSGGRNHHLYVEAKAMLDRLMNEV